jgi:hypothetical protein
LSFWPTFYRPSLLFSAQHIKLPKGKRRKYWQCLRILSTAAGFFIESLADARFLLLSIFVCSLVFIRPHWTNANLVPPVPPVQSYT